MPTNFPISEPVQFSFAGSRAAQADRTLLTQAQDRAERGEDAETIRRETGWHQGVEGRWRFEIADNSAGFNSHLLGNLHSGGFASRMIEHVSYRKDADDTYQLSLAPLAPQKVSDFVSVRAIPKHMLLSLLPMSAIEAIERDEGEEDFIGANLDDAKRVRAPFEFTGFNALPLDAVMDHPTLFAAYPALRDVMVAVDPKLGNGATLGTTDYADGSVGQVIQVGNPRLNDVGSLILHEVQHAIQDIEGFAPGGRIRPLTDEQLADGTGLSAGERYRRLAGEVEARNTQARRNLSDLARKLIAPETTADVPQAEVIVPRAEAPMYSFAGERAATKDAQTLSAAQQRTSAGEDGEPVRQATGWHKGADGKWRYEISDAEARFADRVYFAERDRWYPSRFISDARSHDNDDGGSGSLGAVLDHPALFAAYPALRDMPVRAKIRRGPESGTFDGTGVFAQAETPERLLSVILHEVQHGIQNIEGFAAGGDLFGDRTAYARQLQDELARLIGADSGLQAAYAVWASDQGAMEQAVASGVEFDDAATQRSEDTLLALPKGRQALGLYFSLAKLNSDWTADAVMRDRYQRLAGEVEARNVQTRQQMSDHERALHAPEATADVPKDEWIVPQGANALPDPTKTAAFKAWFGESKVVAADGHPLKVYHGTANAFTVFQEGRGGFYFTDDFKAATVYAAQADGDAPRTIGAYLSIANPLVLDKAWYDENVMAGGEPAWEGVDNAIYEAEEKGHDGLILRGFPDFAGIENGVRTERTYDQYVAFRPEQIKSATDNDGQFDRQNPDIRFSFPEMAEVETAQGPAEPASTVSSDPTQSVTFKRWFEGSKVADEDGQPLMVYHGRDGDFSVFNTLGGTGKTSDTGSFFADKPKAADTYASGSAPNVAPVFLSLKSPVIIDAKGRNWNSIAQSAAVDLPAIEVDDQADEDLLAGLQGREAETAPKRKVKAKKTTVRKMFDGEWDYPDDTATTDDIARWARKNGYDGLIVRNVKDRGPSGRFASDEAAEPGTIYVSFHPEQIKSAIGNNGQFDDNNPDIRFSMADTAEAPLAAQTQTDAFRQWFGENSTLTNPDGSPMALFHGTGSKFTQFRRSQTGAMGPGVYLGDSRDVAEAYDGDGKGAQTVMAVYARGKYLSNRQWTGYIHTHGWSGAEAAATADGWSGVHDQMFEDAVCVWDPAQIKSATDNNGQFDASNPDIRFSFAEEFPPAFREDIPDEDWLRDQVKYASGAGRNTFGVPRMSKITGSFSDSIMVPTELATAAPGQRGEQSNVRTQSVDAIRKILCETGRMPTDANGNEDAPYIEVGYDGKPWVREGNHRIMAAAAEGWEYIPAQVRYFDGGQRLAGPWSPSNLLAATSRASERASVPAVDQPQTEAFKRWFEGSRVVDDAGQPLVVYHGTDENFSVFDARRAGAGNDKGMRGTGIYFSPNEKTAGNYGANLFPVYVNIRNPFVPSEFASKAEIAERLGVDESIFVYSPGSDFRVYQPFSDVFASAVQHAGYDGVLYPQGQEVIAFRSEQIKSATDNNGQFDAGNPDIRFSMAGAVEVGAPAVDQVQTAAFQDWFGASKVVNAQGAPLVMYHGTTETTYVPGTTQAGSASARAELLRMAAMHGIKEWNDVPVVFERWLEMGLAEGFGVTAQVAEHARELQRQARSTTTAPSRVDLGFSVFDMPGAGKELGAHFGTREQALALGVPFAFYLQVENPLRLPDLGTWDYQSVMREARKHGVAISEREYDEVFNARDSNDALRALLLAKGYDGVVYKNEAEGEGDSWIAFRPEQIKSATDNNGQFDGDNPDIRFSQSAEFVSQLMRSIEGAPVRTGSMPADQWIAWIQSSAPRLGIKKDEIEWSGVLDFLALHGHERVTQGELAAYIKKNGVRVAETTMGGPKRYESLEPEYAEHSDSWLVLDEEGVVVADELETRDDAKEWIENYQADFPAGPKYGEYVVPGGQNYREVLITLPAKSDTPFYEALSAKYGKSGKALWNAATPAEREIVDREAASMKVAGQTGYKSGHWSQRNILVHLRVDDRVDAEGNKVLMVHEIQSDWGQDGKKKGIQSAYRQRAPEVTAKVMTGHEFVAERSMSAAAADFWLQGRNDILHDLGKPPVSMEDSFTIIYEDGIPKIVKDGAQDAEAVASTHRRRYDAMLASGRQNHEAAQVEKVPNAPFIADTKAWVALAIKRAIMMAVEGDYDKVSFITGKQAAGIYDLSKQVEIISVHANLDGTYDVGVEMGETDKFFRSQTPAQVEATIGKALAEKGIKAADDWLEADKAYGAALKIDGISEEKLDALRSARSNIRRDFSGDDLKLGGEGMITFYDQIIPQVARDVLKKLGGEGFMGVNFGEKVDGAFGVYDGDELVFSSDSEEDAKEYRLVYPNDATVRPLGLSGAQPGFTITPALRARVLAGVPLFSRVSLPDASAHAEHSAHLARMQALLDADPLFADLQDEHVQDFQRILLAYGAPATKGAHALDWAQVPLEDREAYFAREIELRQYPGHAEYADLAATLPDPRHGKSTVASVQAAIRALINDTGVLGQRLGSIVACTAQDIRTKWVPLIGLQTQASQKARRAQGFYDKTSSTTFLITDNIAAGDELGVVVHELMHKHGEAILGVDGWEQLHGAIKGWASARPGSPERVIHDEATRRVATVRPADTSAERYSSQELFPYAVEVAVKMGIQPSWDAPKDSAGGWLARVRSTLCSVWEKISNKPRDMTAQDLVTLAYGIAHRERTLSDADRCDFPDAADPLSSASFRKWFVKSRAIDAAGDPLVLYHGTEATFETFDYAKIGKNGRDEGAGFYFTDNHKVAAGYGDPMSVYLSIQKPLPYDAKPFCRAVTGRLVRRLAAIEAKSTGGEIADGFLSNYGDVRYEGLEKVVRQAVGMLMDNESAIDQMGDLASSGVSIALVNQAVFDVTGYDSIVSQGYSNCGDADNRIFVAFFPNQIKSASNNCGQFASDSTSIYHSVAWQSAGAATSAWGRFKPAALAAGMACLESNLPIDNSSIVALIENGLLPSNYAQFPSRDNSECEEQTWDRPRFN